MALNNQPATLGKLTAFKENPFPVNIVIDDTYTIVEPIGVEIWTDDVLQDDSTSATVTGQEIDFELSVEQLRQIESSKLYITSGAGGSKRYIFGAPLVTTMEPFVPTPNTTAYQVNEVGEVRVSVWSDAVNALIAQQQATIATTQAGIATTNAGIATAAAADVTTRFQGFVNQFGDELSDQSEIEWIEVGGLMAGTSANGGTANTTTRTISITNGSTGRTSSLTESFDLDNLDNAAVGDISKIRLKLSELIAGTIDSSTVVITMAVNGANHPITYSFLDYGDTGTVYEAIISYTITDLAADLEIKVAIKSDAPVQSPATSITWDSTGYYLDKYLFEQGIDKVAQTTSDFYALFPHQELPSTYAIMDGGGVTDITPWLQDYIADAVAKSGCIEFKRNALHYVATKVDILGGLEMHGHGASIIANDSEAFTVKTTERLWAHHMIIRRNNSSLNATSFKFDSGYSNVDSIIEHVHFYNLPNHLYLDYVKKFKLLDCRFTSGQSGVIVGSVAQDSVSDMEILRNIFDTVFVVSITSSTGNNLTIAHNQIGKYSASSFYGARCIQVAVSAGTHKNVQLLNNTCEAFTEYAYRIAASSGATLDRVLISGGSCRDDSTSTTSSPMRITCASGATFTDLNVTGGLQLITKGNAIDIDAVTNAMVTGVNIRQHTGTYSGSRALNITNSTYLQKSNTGVGLANANVFTGSTLLTEM